MSHDHKELVRQEVTAILNEGYEDLGNGVWARKIKDQPLNESERALAIALLRQEGRSGKGMMMPRMVGDPKADLMGRYLMEIGWRPGDPLPKQLVNGDYKIMETLKVICLVMFVLFVFALIYGALGGSRPH